MPTAFFSGWRVCLMQKNVNLILRIREWRNSASFWRRVTGPPNTNISLRILHMPNQMLSLGCFYSAGIFGTILFFKGGDLPWLPSFSMGAVQKVRSSGKRRSCEVRLKQSIDPLRSFSYLFRTSLHFLLLVRHRSPELRWHRSSIRLD